MTTHKDDASRRQGPRSAGAGHLRLDQRHRRLVVEGMEERVLLSAHFPSPPEASDSPTFADAAGNPYGYLDLGDGRGARIGEVATPILTTGDDRPIVLSGGTPMLGSSAGDPSSGMEPHGDGWLLNGATSGIPWAGQAFQRLPQRTAPSNPFPGPSDHPTSLAVADPPSPSQLGMIDTTPRPSDPVYVVAVSKPAEPGSPWHVPASAGGARGPGVQLATPINQLEGTRGRGQAFDMAMLWEAPEPGRTEAPEQPQAVEAGGADAPSPIARLAAASESVPVSETHTEEAPSKAAASACREAALAQFVTLSDDEAVPGAALLDGNWTKNTLCLLAVAALSRQTVAGSRAKDQSPNDRLARWELRPLARR